MYQKYFKKALDFNLALFLIIIFLPLFMIIFSILFFSNNGKVFYKQERTTLNANNFKLIKFVTMSEKLDSFGKLLPDNQRVTFFGRILRFTSLDEVPNLINVVLGHMSIVGPRPLPSRYVLHMSNEQLRRFSVKSGITGLAQIRGRNNLSLSQKIKLDLFYVDNISLRVDLYIMLSTFRVILSNKQNIELGSKSLDNYEPNFFD